MDPNLPRVSIVIPVKNEALNIRALIDEIEIACVSIGRFEVIYVDDGSVDSTQAELAIARISRPWLRVMKHEASYGQSAAVRTGVRVARGPIIVTMDGDGQNDPVFIPHLVAALDAAGPKVALVAGLRTGGDSKFKRLQSRIANGVRRALLKDDTRDSGCGLKAFSGQTYMHLPYFDALHRFMPALVKREGFEIVHIDVVDRSRHAGSSNYGLLNRLWVGILDLAGVWWLIRRSRRTVRAEEVLL